jgi:hypothetical protein
LLIVHSKIKRGNHVLDSVVLLRRLQRSVGQSVIENVGLYCILRYSFKSTRSFLRLRARGYPSSGCHATPLRDFTMVCAKVCTSATFIAFAVVSTTVKRKRQSSQFLCSLVVKLPGPLGVTVLFYSEQRESSKWWGHFGILNLSGLNYP